MPFILLLNIIKEIIIYLLYPVLAFVLSQLWRGRELKQMEFDNSKFFDAYKSPPLTLLLKSFILIF